MKKLNGKKKLAATFAAAVMAISGGASLSAFATGVDDIQQISGDNAIVDMSGYQEYLDTLTDEQRQLVFEKEQMVDNFVNEQSGGISTLSSGTLVGVPGTFTMYQQETDTYCAPACIKSVLMYTTGSSPTQASIDRVINREFTNIPSYVNSRQKQCNYVLEDDFTQSDLTRRINIDITSYKVPAFLRIYNHYGTNWYYGTDGHCILSNGIYDDLSTILIADPLGDKVTGCPYFYEKPASVVATYTTHFCW